ncbi:MAG: acyl-CoA dehydrogenase family protein [Aerococcus sp.]|nr:acyl-CoA dehydrogenase family protein [Aerococcus sp.]
MSEIYTQAQAFATEHIAPYAEQIDQEKAFPTEAFEAIGKAGYFKLLIPEALGGQGGTIQDHAEVCRAFAEACPTAGLCYMMHNTALMCVLANGSESLIQMITSDIVENAYFMALAYSESGTGTHFYKPEMEVEIKDEMTIFTGKKSMVTSANHAHYYLILAPSVKEGINNWVVPAETAGITFKEDYWNGMGMRGNVSCPMVLDHVALPEKYRIGADGSGLEQVFNVVAPYFVLGLAAVYTGLSEALLKLITTHVSEREYPDGQKLRDIETVQIHMAKIYRLTRNSLLQTEDAALGAVNGDSDALARILSARINASENAMTIGQIAMRIGGGRVYNKYMGIERLFRDSYASQVMAPSVDVLTIWLGKAITGLPIL